jgi:hypothetical protein
LFGTLGRTRQRERIARIQLCSVYQRYLYHVQAISSTLFHTVISGIVLTQSYAIVTSYHTTQHLGRVQSSLPDYNPTCSRFLTARMIALAIRKHSTSLSRSEKKHMNCMQSVMYVQGDHHRAAATRRHCEFVAPYDEYHCRSCPVPQPHIVSATRGHERRRDAESCGFLDKVRALGLCEHILSCAERGDQQNRLHLRTMMSGEWCTRECNTLAIKTVINKEKPVQAFIQLLCDRTQTGREQMNGVAVRVWRQHRTVCVELWCVIGFVVEFLAEKTITFQRVTSTGQEPRNHVVLHHASLRYHVARRS